MVIDIESGKLETQIETSESMRGQDFPHERFGHFPIINILDELNEKDKNHPRFQA